MSTLDKYRRIPQDPPKTEEYEIRVTGRGRIGMYIAYAAKLFLERKFTKCIIKGSGPAISKVCQTSEILRQRIKGLHEECKIYSTEITDLYEPLEEGLDKVEVKKSLTVYEVLLTLNESEVDKQAPGYQEPLPEAQVVAFRYNYDGPEGQGQGRFRRGQRRGRGGRGMMRGRGGRGFRRGGPRQRYEYEDDYYERPQQRYRRPPRYDYDDNNDEDYYEPPRRQQQQQRQRRQQYDYEDEDYQRQGNYRRQQQQQQPRYQDEEDYYEQPRRRQFNRGNRGNQGGYRNKERDYQERDYQDRQQEPKVTRRPRGNRRY